MGVPDPKTPTRADYRFIGQVMKSSYSGEVEHIPAEYEKISRVFSDRGGSWERIFGGSPRDIELLKDVIKAAVKGGFVTKKHKWK